jgi:hypothetical protein
MEAAGYRMEKCVGVDMFPNTVNCEAVVMLDRREARALHNAIVKNSEKIV